MKKFLSLVLALAMTLSLVTISAGAKDFADESDIDYDAAVDVISELGIVSGYGDNSFRPDGLLTRGAAAKIICNLILGPTTAGALQAGTAPFKDVPTTNTFAGYITYCSQQGIISGYGDGTFRPSGSLTGNAFMKMLLGALGYDSSIEGYTGANWQVNVVKQAIGIGLDDGNDSFVGSNPVTRGEAALYAFNMLQATMVEYDSTSTIVVGDITINTSSSRKEVENSVSRNNTIEDDGKMQFAERYFKDLEKKDASDVFGRPSTKWVLDGDDVGTYADGADESYAVEDSGKNVLDILADNDYMSYRDSDIDAKATVYVNSVKQTDDLDDISVQIGDVVEAYEDSDGVVTTVVVRRYELAKIDEVNDDLSASEERNGASVELTLVDLDDKDVGNGTYYDDYDNSDYVLAGYNADYEEGVVLAVALDGNVILDSYIADELTGEISGYRSSSVTMDGTRHPYAASAKALTSVDFDKEYTLYLTAEGFVLGVEGDTGVDINDVYYVTGVYPGARSYGKPSYYAQAVSLADGSVSEIKLDVDDDTKKAGDIDLTTAPTEFKSDGFAGLYTFDGGEAKLYSGDGDYDLKSSASLADDLAIDDNRINLTTGGRFYLDSNTKFLAIDDCADDIEVATATGGMRVGEDDLTGGIHVIVDGRDAVYVILVDVGATMASDDVVYIADNTYDTIGKKQYEGEIWFMATAESDTVVLDKEYGTGFYKVSDIDEDGVYSLTTSGVPTLATKVESDDEGYQLNVKFGKNDVYREALTLTGGSVEYDDISLANAVVIDNRSDADYLYTREINSVSRLIDALDQGNVQANLYVLDGEITFIDVVWASKGNGGGFNPGGGSDVYTATMTRGSDGDLNLTVKSTSGSDTSDYSYTIYVYPVGGDAEKADVAATGTGTLSGGTHTANSVVTGTNNSLIFYAEVKIGNETATSSTIIGG